MTTELIKEFAYKILPHLVHAARMRTLFTYGELAEKAGLSHHRPLNHALGYIRDELCIPAGLPRLNVIVINKGTHLPGVSFLETGTTGLTSEEYQTRFELERDKVFGYEGWETLLRNLGIEPLTSTPDSLDQQARQYNEYISRHGLGGGEGERHKALKEYIAKNPHAIGLLALKKPEPEYEFITEDRCDILVELVNHCYAIIEIKVGDIPGELVKGIYQLVKYRALLTAEKGRGDPFPVDVHLVAYSIPEDVRDYASKFGILCHVVVENLVKSN